MNVVFGGLEDASGELVEDDFVVGISYSDDDSYRVGIAEENPWLANRLHALSLTDWAKTTPGAEAVRVQLRHWEFSPAVGQVSGTWNGQGFLEVDINGRGDGRDVAVLQAVGTVSVVEQPHTGSFPLNKPGIFFDRISFGGFDSLDVDGTLPLTAVHGNSWPDDSCEAGCRVPLASRNGYADLPVFSTGAPNPCDEENDHAFESLLGVDPSHFTLPA